MVSTPAPFRPIIRYGDGLRHTYREQKMITIQTDIKEGLKHITYRGKTPEKNYPRKPKPNEYTPNKTDIKFKKEYNTISI